VLLDSWNHARLTDFGIASPDAAPVGETLYGAAAYLAPERLRGAATNPAVDIYGLGALLYFLIAARPPYSGKSASEIIDQAQAGPPPPLATLIPALPEAVDAIVRRALAPDPADRFPSATAFRDALEEAQRAVATQDVTTRLAATPAATITLASEDEARVAGTAHPAPRGRSRWLVAALATLVVGLLALFLVRAYVGSRGSDSTGTGLVDVPSLEGMTLSQAREGLRGHGLKVGRADTARLPGQPANVVVYQEPPAGTRVKPGTAVNFVLRIAP
jgi:hypothetical protein